tara:strand:- start:1270 stop:1671 length:402 start_codon:yes stop_codon:yes gene_type:complete
MKKFLLICMLCIFGNVFAQNKGTITGTVSDLELDNEPILFATIQLKNTSKTTQTNFHGNYEFSDIEPGNYTMVFSFLGYETIEIPVHVTTDEITRVNGELKPKTLAIDTISMTDIAVSEKPKMTTFQKNTTLK